MVTQDLVIAAHNYNNHFGRIRYLQKGDEVIYTNLDDDDIHYCVVFVDTVSSYAVKEMTSGKYDLSLFTCNFAGTARVTVRCNLVN